MLNRGNLLTPMAAVITQRDSEHLLGVSDAGMLSFAHLELSNFFQLLFDLSPQWSQVISTLQRISKIYWFEIPGSRDTGDSRSRGLEISGVRDTRSSRYQGVRDIQGFEIPGVQDIGGLRCQGFEIPGVRDTMGFEILGVWDTRGSRY